MWVPSLNEIRKNIFELPCTQVKTYGGGVTEGKPVYPRLSSGDIIISSLFGFANFSCTVTILVNSLRLNICTFIVIYLNGCTLMQKTDIFPQKIDLTLSSKISNCDMKNSNKKFWGHELQSCLAKWTFAWMYRFQVPTSEYQTLISKL